MFKKVCFLFCAFSFIMAFNAHANKENPTFSPQGYYGIINVNMIPTTSLTATISGISATESNIFGGGSMGLELIGGLILSDKFLFELGLGYVNHSDVEIEDSYSSSTYIATLATSSIDAKIALLFTSKIVSDEFTFYPYIGPEVGFTNTKLKLTLSEENSSGKTEESGTVSDSGLLYGLKGGIRIPFAEKYLTDIGVAYTRRTASIKDEDLGSVTGRLNSFSVNFGLGINF